MTPLGSQMGALGGPITRDGAREEARRELSKSIYQDAEPGWFSEAVTWINERIADLFDFVVPEPDADGIAGFRGLGVLALLLLLIVLAVVVRLWLGPMRRTARARDSDVDLSSPLSADQLRAQAEEHAGRGAYAEAVRSRLRAVVRMLEEKGVLDQRPGRTAGELVDEVRRLTAEPVGQLATAVEAFSEIWYGGRPASPNAYQTVVAADQALASLRRRRCAADDDRPAYSVPG